MYRDVFQAVSSLVKLKIQCCAIMFPIQIKSNLIFITYRILICTHRISEGFILEVKTQKSLIH